MSIGLLLHVIPLFLSPPSHMSNKGKIPKKKKKESGRTITLNIKHSTLYKTLSFTETTLARLLILWIQIERCGSKCKQKFHFFCSIIHSLLCPTSTLLMFQTVMVLLKQLSMFSNPYASVRLCTLELSQNSCIPPLSMARLTNPIFVSFAGHSPCGGLLMAYFCGRLAL